MELASFSRLTGSPTDDWVDRLNHLYTVTLIVIFACVVTGGQYVGNPIECWMPANFPMTHMGYARTYCWVKNTYYIPMDNSIPVDQVRRESEELTYYQWMPIILMFMAFLFKFPCFVWRLLNGGSAINLDNIVNTLTTATEVGSAAKRKETIEFLAQYMDRWLEGRRHHHDDVLFRFRQRFSRLLCIFGGKSNGTYLIRLYFFVKLLYVANVVCQFFLLNAFMGGWYNMYGIEVLRSITSGMDGIESPRFPKVTLCDFDVRQLENIQRYTIQCVLPVNMFNEKIFIFLWFWFCWVAVLTSGNFLFWVWRAFFRHNRTAYIKKNLLILDELKGEEDKKFAKKFALEYLRDDGIFVLRLVAKNSNNIVVSDLISQLWKIYRDKPLNKTTANGDSDNLV